MKSGRAICLGGMLSALCWATGPVQADDPANGPYIKLESGWSHPTTMPASGPGVPAFTVRPGEGFIAGGAAGIGIKPIRLEFGVDIDRYDLSSVSQNGQTSSASGNARNIALMVNGYYDLPMVANFEPYVGLGVGAVNFALDSSVGGVQQANSSSWAAAVQPIMGASYTISDHFALGLEYRYLTSADPALTNTAGHKFKIDNASHNLLLALIYRFNVSSRTSTPTPEAAPASLPIAAPAAAPAAPVAAAPATHTFLVFFDFDKASLTPAGRHVIDEAIAAYQHDRAAPVELTGYTDLVGLEDYNLDLSRRRAMTVYAYLLFKGVQPSDIGVDWRGKQNPRVAKPGREPENRRVEIVMP